MSNKKYHLATISWAKVLGTVLQYSYFCVISLIGSLLKQCILFEIFLQFSLPPTCHTHALINFSDYWCHYMCILIFFWKVVSPTMGPPSSCKTPKIHPCSQDSPALFLPSFLPSQNLWDLPEIGDSITLVFSDSWNLRKFCKIMCMQKLERIRYWRVLY